MEFHLAVLGGVVDGGDFVSRQAQIVEHAQIVLELIEIAHTDQGRGHFGAAQHPRERQLHHGLATGFGDLAELVDSGQNARFDMAGAQAAIGVFATGAGLVALIVLAREHALGQR